MDLTADFSFRSATDVTAAAAKCAGPAKCPGSKNSLSIVAWLLGCNWK